MLPKIYEYGTPVKWREGLSPSDWPDNQPLPAETYSTLIISILEARSSFLWSLNPVPGDIVRVAGMRDHEALGVFVGHLQDQDSINRGEPLKINNLLYRIKSFSTGEYHTWRNVTIVQID